METNLRALKYERCMKEHSSSVLLHGPINGNTSAIIITVYLLWW